MEDDTEKQILKELENINESLEQMNEKLDDMDEVGDTSFSWDILKVLLIGIILMAPAVGFVVIIWQVIKNLFFG